MAGQYDESKHKRDKGQFAKTEGQGADPARDALYRKADAKHRNQQEREKHGYSPNASTGTPGQAPNNPQEAAARRAAAELRRPLRDQIKSREKRESADQKEPDHKGVHEQASAGHEHAGNALKEIEAGRLRSAGVHGKSLQLAVQQMREHGADIGGAREHLVKLSHGLKTGDAVMAHEAATGLRHEMFKHKHEASKHLDSEALKTASGGKPAKENPFLAEALQRKEKGGTLGTLHHKALAEHYEAQGMHEEAAKHKEARKTGEEKLAGEEAKDKAHWAGGHGGAGRVDKTKEAAAEHGGGATPPASEAEAEARTVPGGARDLNRSEAGLDPETGEKAGKHDKAILHYQTKQKQVPEGSADHARYGRLIKEYQAGHDPLAAPDSPEGREGRNPNDPHKPNRPSAAAGEDKAGNQLPFATASTEHDHQAEAAKLLKRQDIGSMDGALVRAAQQIQAGRQLSVGERQAWKKHLSEGVGAELDQVGTRITGQPTKLPGGDPGSRPVRSSTVDNYREAAASGKGLQLYDANTGKPIEQKPTVGAGNDLATKRLRTPAVEIPNELTKRGFKQNSDKVWRDSKGNSIHYDKDGEQWVTTTAGGKQAHHDEIGFDLAKALQHFKSPGNPQ